MIMKNIKKREEKSFLENFTAIKVTKEGFFKATFLSVCLVMAIKSPITAAPLNWNSMATSEVTEIITGVVVPEKELQSMDKKLGNNHTLLDTIKNLQYQQEQTAGSVKDLQRKQKEMDDALKGLEQKAIQAISDNSGDDVVKLKKTLNALQEQISTLKKQNQRSTNVANNTGAVNGGGANDMKVGVMTTESLCYDYDINGSKVNWKPTIVFDNGNKTYIKMGIKYHNENPELYVWNGEDWELTEYNTEMGMLVVDGTFNKAELRYDGKVIAINK